MHPIEHLRYVARASGADPSLLVTETATALAGVLRVEPAGLVPACRRLIERHLTTGPIWWLAAQVLVAADPIAAARAARLAMQADGTAALLAAAIPDDSTVVIVGWPEVIAAALRRRGDVEVLVVDAMGEGSVLARRLNEGDGDAVVIPDVGVAAAVVVADLVLVEATAGGPTGVLASLGSHSAAAVAANRGIPVWAAAGVGRVLPAQLWEALVGRLDEGDAEPWERPVELVPAGLLSGVVGPSGACGTAEGLAQATCPVAPELLRRPG